MNIRMLALCMVFALVLSMRTSVASAAAPLRCLAPDTSGATHELGAPIVDAIETTDATQTGRLETSLPGAPSACGAPKAAPAVVDATNEYPFRAYTFVNRSRSAACIEVLANVAAGPPEIGALGAGFHQSAAYLGAFDHGLVRSGYLGDNGTHDSGPGTMRYAFDVPALATFVVVVSWTGPAEAGWEPNYELFVGGCGQLVITGISPSSGDLEGETLVTIKGSGFEGAAPLTVDIGTAATKVLAVDDTTILAVTSATPAGTYDVVVKSTVVSDRTGQPAMSTLPAAYQYVDDTPAADAGRGPSTGGGGEGLAGDGGTGGEPSDEDGGAGEVAGTDGGGSADAGGADAGIRGPRPGGSGSGSGVPAREDTGGGCSASRESREGEAAGAAWLVLVGGSILIMRRRYARRVG